MIKGGGYGLTAWVIYRLGPDGISRALREAAPAVLFLWFARGISLVSRQLLVG